MSWMGWYGTGESCVFKEALLGGEVGACWRLKFQSRLALVSICSTSPFFVYLQPRLMSLPFGFGKLLFFPLLMTNAVAVLSEDRFLARSTPCASLTTDSSSLTCPQSDGQPTNLPHHMINRASGSKVLISRPGSFTSLELSGPSCAVSEPTSQFT